MKMFKKSIACVGTVLAMATMSHSAEITIWDTLGTGGTGVGSETGETEPGTVNNNSWDLKRVDYSVNMSANTRNVTLYGGYDFKNGQSASGAPNGKFLGGDVFFDIYAPTMLYGVTAPTPSYVNGTPSTRGDYQIYNNFGYDYVVQLDWANSQWNLLQINSASKLLSTYYTDLDFSKRSNPWRYDSGGTLIETGVLTLGAANPDFSLSLTFTKLPVNNYLGVHYTMQCGNDNLMGSTGGSPDPIPDGGLSIMLLGLGTFGLGMARRFVA